MPSYSAASVSAKIELDTTEFKKAVEQLKGEVKGLKSAFNILKGDNPLAKDVEKLKKDVDSLTETNKKYREELKKLREERNNLTKGGKSDPFKNIKKGAEEATESVQKVDKATQLFRKNFESIKNATYLGKHVAEFKEIEKAADSATQATKRYLTAAGEEVAASIKARNKAGEKNSWGGHAPVEGIKADDFFNIDFEQLGFEAGKKALQDFLKAFSNAKLQIVRDAEEIENAIRKFAQFDYRGTDGTKFDNFGKSLLRVAENAKKANEALGNVKPNTSAFDSFVGVADKVQNALKNITPSAREAKQEFENFKTSATGFAPVLEKAFTAATEGAEKYRARIAKIADELKAKWHSLSVELAKANAAQYKFWQQTRGSSGAWNAEPLSIKGYNDYLKAANAVAKYNAQLEKNIALEKKRRSALAAKDEIAYSMQNFQAASSGMQLLNTQMETNNKRLAENAKNARNAGKGITTFNNGVVQTAHSGRILSNTLYQIRGALLSLKMILTAMGGMALWGFAMDVAEGIKETFTSKNEMEAQLNANAKVGASGINTFNRALDETVSKFQKINKYALGETVSSIGLEFELTAKQMEKAMPIVSMIQSEYVRAGRTQEEAALAVKDILQGEFQRLSRETGVGKEELLAYGWSGDKTDIDSLLEALDKAAKDRNWDLFASKATSLNDVIQITKSRFEEFGADLLQTISPAIVSGFNFLLDSFGKIKEAFDGLGTFGKNLTVGGGILGGIAALATAIPMVTKGMGLADIATIGWVKSLATAALNLNKAEVANYGFRRALAAVISGTDAAEVSETRWSKAIMGRLLGVDQAVLREKGYLGALTHHKMVLKDVTIGTNELQLMSGKWHQKLAYLTKDIDAATAKNLKWHQSLRQVIFSWKALRLAILGVLAIGIVAWYSSLATWADQTKKNVDALNEVIDNGDEMYASAEKKVNNYTNALSQLTEGTKEYEKANNNLKVATANRDDIQMANKLAQGFKKQNEELEENIANRQKAQLAASYQLAGLDGTEASERASGWTQKVLDGQAAVIESERQYEHRLYQANQHINERLLLMSEEDRKSKQTLKYIDEYSRKAEEVAENWKKFYQGDLTSGMYAVLGELQLMWIDLWNDPHFVNFWKSVQNTWKDIKPTVYAIKDALIELGQVLLDFFATKEGQIVGGIAATGIALFAVGTKIYHVLGGAKSTIDILKTLGGKLKDIAGRWKDVGDKAEEANTKMGGDKSTGGINGDVGKGSGSFKEQLGTQLKADATKYARAAVAIAAGMLLITEAIVLLRAPMAALAELGWQFKQWEPEIRKGIEGLQLIAPTVTALLVPVVALAYLLGRFDVSSTTILKGAGKAAIGIAAGMLLVAEAIYMLKAPMWALSQIGNDYAIGKEDIQGGITAMQVMGDALQYMVPFIPIFAAGIALAAITFAAPELGILVDLAVVTGIAAGMLLLAEAVVALRMPLEAIRELGNSFTDIEGAKKGAEAIKLCAEAMTYVEEATRAMALVQWDLIAYYIGDVINKLTGTDLTKLTEEGGFLSEIKEFAEGFNKYEIPQIQMDKVNALKTTAAGLTSVGEALQAAKTAMDNLPDEFKGGTDSIVTGYNSETGQKTPTDTTGYFDPLLEPLRELKSFIDQFNGEEFAITPPDPERVTAIQQSASMLEQIKTAVDAVKVAMQGVGDAGWAANMAEGGLGAAISGWFGGLGGGSGGGTGTYSSSLGSSFQQLEDVIKDIVTFNSNVSTLTSETGNGDGNGGNVEALAGMVTAVDQAIQNLSTTLTNAVPQIKGNANAIGQGIHTGIREGIGDLSTTVKNKIATAGEAGKPVALTYGKGIGGKLTEGYKAELKVKEATQSEIDSTLEYLESKKPDFYNKGKALGEEVSRGYRDGDEMHSPGIIARSTFQELQYVEDAFDAAILKIPAKAEELGASLADNYSPAIATDIGITDMTAYEAGLSNIAMAANDTDLQTTTALNDMNTTAAFTMQGMSTSVNGAFANIKQNATTSYAQITNTTRVSLKNMQDQTTKNINAIRQSWRGMQNALIASAENIRSETSAKIHSLQNNMAEFWRKVQNPALLLGAGSAKEAKHTSRRRYGNGNVSKSSGRGMLAAGSSKLGQKKTGIPDSLRQRLNNDNLGLTYHLFEYLMCLLNNLDNPNACSAGSGSGWSFNWAPDIQEALLKWHTHFGDIYDPYLTVGKFENDTFPVRGIKEIALNYIEDAIGRTSYSYYYDHNYGSALEAWNAGSFNCVDGAMVAIGFADAFGFPGGYIGYGTWDGEGHGFAVIPGLGVIDATAIQKHYGLTSPKVSGYPSAGTRPRNSAPPKSKVASNNYNGDVYITINTNGNDVEVNESKIDNTTGKKILDLLGINPSTGK